MAGRQSEDLLQIAHGAPDTEYVPEAIEAARAELDRRGVTDADWHEIETQVISEREADSQRPVAELTNVQMVGLLVIGPLLLISIPIVLAFSARGYRRKAIDAIKVIAFSYVLYLLIGWGVLLVAGAFNI